MIITFVGVALTLKTRLSELDIWLPQLPRLPWTALSLSAVFTPEISCRLSVESSEIGSRFAGHFGSCSAGRRSALYKPAILALISLHKSNAQSSSRKTLDMKRCLSVS
jgi:hypothetical protein